MIWRGECVCFEVLFEEVIQLLLYDQGQGVDFGVEFLSVRDKFNGMVPLLLLWELIKGLLSEDISELLVGPWHNVLEAC